MLIVAILFLIMLSIAKSEDDYETTCRNNYRDLNNTPIKVFKYCINNLCIEKCCGAGKIMDINNNTCMNVKKLFKRRHRVSYLKSKIDYSTIILSSRDVNEKSIYNFALIHNNRDVFKCTELPSVDNEYEYNISEDGSIRWLHSETQKWNQIKKLEYCIEYKLVLLHGKPDIKIIIRQLTKDPLQTQEIEGFEIVAILISSFFLMLVLVVYCLVPYLRNLSGMVLMAYTFSLLFAFVNKLILTFVKRDPPEKFCESFSPVVYFAFMSSIFWLSVISFDLWWGIRAFRIKRASKRTELVKFMWYGLYAWGIPLLITAIVITLDKNIAYLDILEPPFRDCLVNGKSFDYYYKIPIGILIFINIVLFVMTIYNICMVKYGVDKYKNSRSNKQQNNKFSTYAKLSVVTGVSWCLELVPSQDKLILYILFNLYNLLTGVAIFYWFVCEKKVLVQLCKKFNIRNDFTKKLFPELSQHDKSGITRTTRVASSIVKDRSRDQNQETDLLQNFPKEESTIV